MSFPLGMHRCAATGQCFRLVFGSALFCCADCAFAWVSEPRFEPEHSDRCDQRAADRADFDRALDRPDKTR